MTAERDRVLWLAIRRGLLLIIKAIEARYDLVSKETQTTQTSRILPPRS